MPKAIILALYAKIYPIPGATGSRYAFYSASGARRDGQGDAVQACSLLCPTPSYHLRRASKDSSDNLPGLTPAGGFTPPAGIFFAASAPRCWRSVAQRVRRDPCIRVITRAAGHPCGSRAPALARCRAGPASASSLEVERTHASTTGRPATRASVNRLRAAASAPRPLRRDDAADHRAQVAFGDIQRTGHDRTE